MTTNLFNLIDGFNMIEGNSERKVMGLKGDEARAAFNTFVEGKGYDAVTELLESGMAETVLFNGELYFNLYI